MAAIYSTPYDVFIKRLPSALRESIQQICTNGKVDTQTWFADNNHKAASKTHNIYTTLSNVNRVEKAISKAKGKTPKTIDKTSSPYTFKQYDDENDVVHSFKLHIDGAVSIPASATTTAKQERGSAWIIKRALSDNKKYSQWQDIIHDEKYEELCELYPEHSFEWIKVFFTQHQKMLSEYSNHDFHEYNRDGGFMNFISDLVTERFGVSNKDSWNPADIWMIKGSSKAIEKKILDKLEGNKKTQTISELNTILRVLFRTRTVVGISLKKTSGKQAFYEELNTKIRNPVLKNTLSYQLEDIFFKFDTQDTTIKLTGGNNKSLKIQIKANDSKLSSLKWEASGTSASAKLGKVPVDLLDRLMKGVHATLYNKFTEFPKDTKEFEENATTYWEMFRAIKSHLNTGNSSVSSKKDFVEKMKSVFENQGNYVGNSKCMQLKFLHEFLTKVKEKKERNDFLTDLIFLAEKRGQKFGPFGKLY